MMMRETVEQRIQARYGADAWRIEFHRSGVCSVWVGGGRGYLKCPYWEDDAELMSFIDEAMSE